MEKGCLTLWYQYRDPLVGILDYILEVCPPVYNLILVALSGPKEM
jgi:hypothetical protein